jgi:hypothetical protein
VILANRYSICASRSMSKCHRPVLLFLGAIVLALQGICSPAAAQDLIASIRITANEPRVAVVKGKFASGNAPQSVYFLDRFGSVTGLDARITDVRFTDRGGRLLEKSADGRYVGADFLEWEYRVDLSPLDNRFAAAHVSRSDSRGAVIVLDDILPQMPSGSRSARVALELPTGWTIATSEDPIERNTYAISDLEKAVFVAGPAIRRKKVRKGRSELNISITGDWLFTDDEAAEMAGSVFTTYERIFGSVPAEQLQIAIMPFPNSVPVGEWEAGSRGTSITIVSSDMPFKNQSVQRLHEQLRHEIFHLWVPNGIKLTGNYDWFYEGFALYTSLKTGVAANRIRFDDMLDTIGRAYDIGGPAVDDGLIGLSRSRWTGSNTRIYARGLLIAFLCDIAALEASKGKRSIYDVLKAVYERHRSSGPYDANKAILTILRSHERIKPLVERYIVSGGAVEWQLHLRTAGLESVGNTGPTRLRAVSKPTGRQRQMLDDLGYNNWRKMSGGNR